MTSHVRVGDIKTAVLAYFVGIDHVFGVLRDGAGTERVFQLDRCSEILPRIEILLEAMDGSYSARRSEDTFDQFSREWGAALLPPATALENSDVLIVIPHSILHGVPLHAVIPNGGGRPLALTHGVTYAPSGTLFVRCVDRNRVRHFDASKWEFPRTGANETPPAPSSCRATAIDVKYQGTEEYRTLAELFLKSFPETYFADGIRTSAKPGTRWPYRADVHCIICHGHHDPQYPGRSGLLLGSRPGTSTERKIPIHLGHDFLFRDLPFRFFPSGEGARADAHAEILSVDELMVDSVVDAELVTLIGCSTAAGQTSSADDFLSLANQFLKIGAASVLASMWVLDFGFAARWVPRFLKHWCDLRTPKALAMRESMREELAGKASPVAEWAVPALFGDWM